MDMLMRAKQADLTSTLQECGSLAVKLFRTFGAMGHDVLLMALSYIKPYVKRGKNAAVDAEAICEAMSCNDIHVDATSNANIVHFKSLPECHCHVRGFYLSIARDARTSHP